MSYKIDRSLVDIVPSEHDGYPEELAKQDNYESLRAAAEEAGAIITEFSNAWYIEPNERADRARFNLENKMRAFDFVSRFTNQGGGNGIRGTHECTTHSLTRAWEGSYVRQQRIPIGPPVAKTKLILPANANPVWVSQISIYAEANPGQWGGASVREVLHIAARRGFLPEPIQPKEYGFKHTLHGTCGVGNVTNSRGPWVPLSRFPEGWQETAKHLKPREFIFPQSLDEAICLILHGLFVCVGRDGHAVPWGDVDIEQQLLPYMDSYDRILYDSFSRASRSLGGAFAIPSTEVPDDWNHPAGLPA